MKTIRVLTDQWFTKATFNEVKMLAIKHLNVPADVMNDSHKPEGSRRAIARQVFNKSHEYGEEFEIIESSNPFGKVPKRRSTTPAGAGLEGEYRWVKCGMRAPEDDIRWQMMKVVEEHTKFEDAIVAWDKEAGAKTLFKSTGAKHQFNFIDQVKWALSRGWIIKV